MWHFCCCIFSFKGTAMPRIINEPFPPKRQLTKKRLPWWRVALGIFSLLITRPFFLSNNNRPLKKAHLLRSPRSNVSVNSPPLVDFSRASHLDLLNSLGSGFFNSLIRNDSGGDPFVHGHIIVNRSKGSSRSTRSIRENVKDKEKNVNGIRPQSKRKSFLRKPSEPR